MVRKEILQYYVRMAMGVPILFALSHATLADDKENHVMYGYVTSIERDAVRHETRVQMMDTGIPPNEVPFICDANGSNDLLIKNITVTGYHSNGNGGYILELGPNPAEDYMNTTFQGSVPGFGFYVIYNVIYNNQTNMNECVINGLRSSLR